ncbi:MAG: hypothetical protein ACXWWR_00995 [Candidatus Limnocylindrales bacterium]
MRRLIIGATAIVTGLVAAVGVVVRRRRARRDDVLPLDPAPPLGSSALASHEPVAAPSTGAVGPVGDPPAAAKRKPRSRRKASTTKSSTAGGGTTGKARAAATTTSDAAGQAAKPAVRAKRPTRVRTSSAATPVERVEPAAGDEADPTDAS